MSVIKVANIRYAHLISVSMSILTLPLFTPSSNSTDRLLDLVSIYERGENSKSGHLAPENGNHHSSPGLQQNRQIARLFSSSLIIRIQKFWVTCEIWLKLKRAAKEGVLFYIKKIQKWNLNRIDEEMLFFKSKTEALSSCFVNIQDDKISVDYSW